MIFKTTVPILYSTDVVKSLTYYVDVLGFESRWNGAIQPISVVLARTLLKFTFV